MLKNVYVVTMFVENNQFQLSFSNPSFRLLAMLDVWYKGGEESRDFFQYMGDDCSTLICFDSVFIELFIASNILFILYLSMEC